MTDEPLSAGVAEPTADGPLAWEDLGSRPAGAAFRASLRELLAHPRRFFGRMATSGGLHEPVTFFAILLAVSVLAAFAAALAYFGAAAPSPESVPAAVYDAYVRPARLTGLLVAMLPGTLVAGCAAMALLGGLFHAAGKAFGSRNWEGSVSIWLYSCSAALAPLAAGAAVVLAVSLCGYLLGLAWEQAAEPAAAFARWTVLIVGPAGLLAALVLLFVETTAGCAAAFDLDPMLGAAAAVAGVLLVGLAVGGAVWSAARWGVTGGVGAGALVAGIAVALTIGGMASERRAVGRA